MRSILLLLGLLLASGPLAACQPVRPQPALTVSLVKPEDVAQVRSDGSGVVVDIYSPRGIGEAHLDWQGEPPDEGLHLRLHLAGLEGLQVANEASEAALSVSSSPPYEVRAEGGAHGISVQRGEGVFDVLLDGAWLRDGSLTVRWVDLYR